MSALLVTASFCSRLYLVNEQKPFDEMCQQCAFCGHEFLDEPNSNGPALAENTQKLLMYDQDRADAEANKNNKQQVIGTKGTAITRAPPRPTLKPIYVQCHCFQQENIQSDGSNQGSSCQINCTDPVSKKRYPRDVNGIPTCPICKCTCQAAYKIGSQQTILILRQQGRLKDNTPI